MYQISFARYLVVLFETQRHSLCCLVKRRVRLQLFERSSNGPMVVVFLVLAVKLISCLEWLDKSNWHPYRLVEHIVRDYNGG
ncbi:hypothetical protein PM082_004365 [Marasmius tenuissimus]|nr:hypothetical protein PM082_004365 [Marasmius tenuissimus]